MEDIKAYLSYINQHFKLHSKFEYVNFANQAHIKKIKKASNKKNMWLDILKKYISLIYQKNNNGSGNQNC